MGKYDYRGGGLGDRASTVPETIQNIRTGNTNGARTRDMALKGAVSGAMLGLQFGGAALSKYHDDNLRERAASKAEKMAAWDRD